MTGDVDTTAPAVHVVGDGLAVPGTIFDVEDDWLCLVEPAVSGEVVCKITVSDTGVVVEHRIPRTVPANEVGKESEANTGKAAEVRVRPSMSGTRTTDVPAVETPAVTVHDSGAVD